MVSFCDFVERVAGLDGVEFATRVGCTRASNRRCRRSRFNGFRRRDGDFLFQLEMLRVHGGIRRLQLFQRNVVSLGNRGERVAFHNFIGRAGQRFGNDRRNRRRNVGRRRIGGHRERDGRVRVHGRRNRDGRVRVHAGQRIGVRRRLALATLDEHDDEAEHAHGEHAADGDLELEAALALLLEQRAFGDKWIRVVHSFVWRKCVRFLRCVFSFDFCAAKLSLKKFLDVLNCFSRQWNKSVAEMTTRKLKLRE